MDEVAARNRASPGRTTTRIDLIVGCVDSMACERNAKSFTAGTIQRRLTTRQRRSSPST